MFACNELEQEAAKREQIPPEIGGTFVSSRPTRFGFYHPLFAVVLPLLIPNPTPSARLLHVS